MSPFWGSLFDHLKDCGRHAAIFIFALGGFFAALAVVAVILFTPLRQYAAQALPVVGLMALIWVIAAVRRARVRSRLRLPSGPLSDDELCKARTKLARNRGPR